MHSLIKSRGRGPFAGGSVLAGCVVVFAIASCRDVTPPSVFRPGGKAAHALNPPGTVTVTSSAMHGWIFYDDQHDSTCTDATVCRMVSGPSGSAGSGSLELVTSSSSDGKAAVLADYAGTRFDQISALTYQT